jgi:hypothetical protein
VASTCVAFALFGFVPAHLIRSETIQKSLATVLIGIAFLVTFAVIGVYKLDGAAHARRS